MFNIIVTLKCGLEVTQDHWKMVPFQSLGTVSYSPSIVTMAVSLAILEIFSSVKEWPDQWKWRGSIDHACMTFYWSAIVTIALSCTVFELFDVEYYRDLEIWLRDDSRSSKLVPFESLCAVSYSPSIVTMAVSLAILEIFCVKEWRDLEMWVWGPSRSLRMARFDRPCMTFY